MARFPCLGAFWTSLVCLVTLLVLHSAVNLRYYLPNDIEFLRKRDNSQDWGLSHVNPKSFFLVESSGRNYLTQRELCTIESVATHHPEQSVYVVHTSEHLELTHSRYKLMEIYPNVQFRPLQFEPFILGSPIEELWRSHKIQSSWYLVSHVSDVLRYLILHKFGGTYLDLDQLVLKPFPNLPNFVGKESHWVASGVMRFQLGHPILDRFLEELRIAFKGWDWSSNGPYLVSRVLESFCGSLEVGQCRDITILPQNAFYPIHWKKWHRYFDFEETDSVLQEVEQTHSIHLWGKQSASKTLKDTNAYTFLAAIHCPVTYSEY